MKQKKTGNLVIREGEPGNSKMLWQSKVKEKRGKFWTRLQRDGNLITKRGTDKSGDTVWKTRTASEPNEHYFLGVTTNRKSLELWKGTRHKTEKLLWSEKTKRA